MIGLRAAVLGFVCLGLIAALPGPAVTQSTFDSPWPEDWLYPEQGDSERWRTRGMGTRQKQRLERHQSFIGVPDREPYTSMTNPLAPTQATIDAGAVVYNEHCVECHGAAGYGDGDAGLAVDPSPALLAFMVQMPRAVDGYLMWSIAEGGAGFASEMPGYKDVLTEREIWQVITFMRSGFGRGRD